MPEPDAADRSLDMLGLPFFISALMRPEAYPHPVSEIRLLQTHISYVLLTGPFAYKIKKQVNFGFLDFSTLDKRRQFCHEEVALNSRLCPEIYVGVVDVRESNGEIRIGSGRHIVEYAVKMVQLPEEKMMQRLLEEGKVTRTMIQRLAEKLVGFYRRARRGPEVARYGEPRWIQVNTEENFSQVLPYVGRTLTADQFQLIKRYTEDFLCDKRQIFEQRVLDGYIRDGHGDLRPENICFADDICIFDCIEFNERLRCEDVASDISFLIMELEYRACFALAAALVKDYVHLSGDIGSHEVLTFYKVYRAFVRGKVESFKLDEPEIPDEERQRSGDRARAYFHLAASYLR